MACAELLKNKIRLSCITIFARIMNKVDRLLLNALRKAFTELLAFIYTNIQKTKKRDSMLAFDLLKILGIKLMTGLGKFGSKPTKNKNQSCLSFTRRVKLGIKFKN